MSLRTLWSRLFSASEPPLKFAWWSRATGRFECWAVEKIETHDIVAGPFGIPEMAEWSRSVNERTWGRTHRVIHLMDADDRIEELETKVISQSIRIEELKADVRLRSPVVDPCLSSRHR